MTNTKHTPGPWFLAEDEQRILCHMDREDCDDVEQIGVFDAYYPHAPYVENARLCAAAPELLEALGGVLSLIDELNAADEFGPVSDEEIDERVIAARAAIAKATGEQG